MRKLAPHRHPPVSSLDHAADQSPVPVRDLAPKQDAFSGKLWPDHPTIRNFDVVLGQKHYFLGHFWNQLWNSSSSPSRRHPDAAHRDPPRPSPSRG
jgi:hypothetical protein